MLPIKAERRQFTCSCARPVALVNVLIQNGADVNAVTKMKKAAIH